MSTTTEKYGFIKPELTDAADITATNSNWDKLEDALSLRLYTDLSQIDLTVGSETIESIARNLPNYSRIMASVGSGNNTEIYPNGNYGLLVVEKTTNSRIVFTFTNNKGTQWIGVYTFHSSGNIWTDWQRVYSTSDNLILTQYAHYGISLPTAGTPGRIFFKKV